MTWCTASARHGVRYAGKEGDPELLSRRRLGNAVGVRSPRVYAAFLHPLITRSGRSTAGRGVPADSLTPGKKVNQGAG